MRFGKGHDSERKRNGLVAMVQAAVTPPPGWIGGDLSCAQTCAENIHGSKFKLLTQSKAAATNSPSFNELVGAKQVNATAIESWWRKLGWSLPETRGEVR
jgi:hypothetical protein